MIHGTTAAEDVWLYRIQNEAMDAVAEALSALGDDPGLDRALGIDPRDPLYMAAAALVPVRQIVVKAVADAMAKVWDEARQKVRDAGSHGDDSCDLCIARDEVLDDLSDNPYRTETDRG